MTSLSKYVFGTLAKGALIACAGCVVVVAVALIQAGRASPGIVEMFRTASHFWLPAVFAFYFLWIAAKMVKTLRAANRVAQAAGMSLSEFFELDIEARRKLAEGQNLLGGK